MATPSQGPSAAWGQGVETVRRMPKAENRQGKDTVQTTPDVPGENQSGIENPFPFGE